MRSKRIATIIPSMTTEVAIETYENSKCLPLALRSSLFG